MASGFTPPEVCPVCGEAVPRDALACPGCGADERSGWDEEATRYDDLDLPDEAFAGEKPAAPKDRFGGVWVAVAIILLILVTGGLMFR